MVDDRVRCCLPAKRGRVRAAIDPRTKVVIPVHLYGCTTDMDALAEVCHQARIHIALAFGQLDGRSPRCEVRNP